MKFVNMTPHAIRIKTDSVDITVEPSGILARVNTTEVESVDVFGIPTIKRVMGDVEFTGSSTPTTDESTIILVSAMVLDALPDSIASGLFFAPDTGATAERNDKGHIVSVCRLVGKS